MKEKPFSIYKYKIWDSVESKFVVDTNGDEISSSVVPDDTDIHEFLNDKKNENISLYDSFYELGNMCIQNLNALTELCLEFNNKHEEGVIYNDNLINFITKGSTD